MPNTPPWEVDEETATVAAAEIAVANADPRPPVGQEEVKVVPPGTIPAPWGDKGFYEALGVTAESASAIWNQDRHWSTAGRGRRRKFETPDDLWKKCCAYFQWCLDNPILEAKHYAHEGKAYLATVPHARAFTVYGLFAFAEIRSPSAWYEWQNPDHKNYRGDLVPVIETVNQIIYEQKFTGAAAGIFNAMLIAREIGLSDKSEVTNDVTARVGKLELTMMPMPSGTFLPPLPKSQTDQEADEPQGIVIEHEDDENEE